MNTIPKTELARVLRLRDLVLLVIGLVIGSGIFIVPAAVLRQTRGSIPLAMFVWLAGGVFSVLGALTYAELAAMKPHPGGFYVYIRDCFGRLPAFLCGWTLFFMMNSGSTATLSVAFSAYLGELVPLSPILAKLVAIAGIVVVTIVNVRGTRQSADLQNWTTAVKIVAIFIMSIGLLWLGRGFQTESAHVPIVWSSGLLSTFGLAMIGVLWAYEGWQYSPFSSAETINPQRDMPRALLAGSMALTILYLLANLGYIAALGPVEAGRTDSVASAAVAAVAGPTAAKLVTIAILISIFSANNALTLTGPRVYFAMAKDGLFFRRLAQIHPRYGTPAFAIMAGSAWSIVLTATGTFEQLFTYVIFSGWFFYGLAAASIFVYRRRMPDLARPYRVHGYPWTPLLFVIACVVLVSNTIAAAPVSAIAGLGMMLLGVPAYFVWARSSRSM